MTKYVLNSGSAKNFPEKEGAFIKEVISGLGTEIKVLYCFFSQPREDWEERYEKYQERFSELVGDEIKLSFELAFPDKFEKQIKRSDVVLIQGGDDHLLKFWLGKFDLPKIWEGKVVVGSSAGSSALVKSFWTCDWRKCMDGFGILPIKFIPHYKSETYGKNDPRGPIDWEKTYKELAEYGDKSLTIHALEEGDYIVIEK